jgi:hypothetical protein
MIGGSKGLSLSHFQTGFFRYPFAETWRKTFGTQPLLGVNSFHYEHIQHSFDRRPKCVDSHIDLLRARNPKDISKRFLHYLLQTVIDLLFTPKESNPAKLQLRP